MTYALELRLSASGVDLAPLSDVLACAWELYASQIQGSAAFWEDCSRFLGLSSLAGTLSGL